ncbi:MAG: FAD-dependent oxidoreductase [Acidobacteria bacterium]|nr:MAG: FAD-dependent oxidoreductase [Acidobacteriota bacterium]
MTTSSGLTAIIGGGIAGLSAAWTLQQAGRACVVLEASDRWGGAIASERVDGFLLEGGPDSFLAGKPAAVELCRELGLEGELIGTEPQPGGPRLLHRGHTRQLGDALIASGRPFPGSDTRPQPDQREGGSNQRWPCHLQPLPAGWRMLAPTRLGPVLRSPLFSPAVKAAVIWHWPRTAAPPREDETVAAYLERRFGRHAGRAFTQIIVQPLLAGVYGGRADCLSAVPPSAPGDRPSGAPIFMTLRGGMGTLVAKLVERLQPCLRAHSCVQAIARNGAGFRLELEQGDPLDASSLIVAAPAWRAATLLRDFDAELAAPLASIPFSSSVNVNLAYRTAPALPPGHGFLAGGDSDLQACTFAHQKFSGRAPAGAALLRLFYGEALAEAANALIEAHARADVAAILGVTQPPDLVRIRACRRALPQYTVGHNERVKRLLAALERYPRLALAGNAYAGVGVPDCIASGVAAAARITSALG